VHLSSTVLNKQSSESLFHLTLVYWVCVTRGADLSSLVREAAVRALKEHMSLMPLKTSLGSGVAMENLPAMVVTVHHFLQALIKIKPSVSEKVKTEFFFFRGYYRGLVVFILGMWDWL